MRPWQLLVGLLQDAAIPLPVSDMALSGILAGVVVVMGQVILHLVTRKNGSSKDRQHAEMLRDIERGIAASSALLAALQLGQNETRREVRDGFNRLEAVIKERRIG